MLAVTICLLLTQADNAPPPKHIAKWQAAVMAAYERSVSSNTEPHKRLLDMRPPINGPKRKAYEAQLKATKPACDKAMKQQPKDFLSHVRFDPNGMVGEIGEIGTIRVWRVLGAKSAVVEYGNDRFVMSGIDASKWTDDARIDLSATFEITGIDKSTGSTLNMVKPFDTTKWMPKAVGKQPAE